MLKTLTRLFPSKLVDLEANLVGVAGFTGRGEFEYAAFSNGHRSIEVEVRGAAGVSADVYVNDTQIAKVSLNNGRADEFFDSRKGSNVPSLEQGSKVEIRQNGQVILEGVLAPD